MDKFARELSCFQSGLYNHIFRAKTFFVDSGKHGICAIVDIILGILLSLRLGILSAVNEEWEALSFISKLFPLHLHRITTGEKVPYPHVNVILTHRHV